MVLTDGKSNAVKILNRDGKLKSSIFFDVEGGAGDVTVINSNHVAVSNLELQTISIIDAKISKIINTLQVKSNVRGITHCGGHLYLIGSAKKNPKYMMTRQLIIIHI